MILNLASFVDCLSDHVDGPLKYNPVRAVCWVLERLQRPPSRDKLETKNEARLTPDSPATSSATPATSSATTPPSLQSYNVADENVNEKNERRIWFVNYFRTCALPAMAMVVVSLLCSEVAYVFIGSYKIHLGTEISGTEKLVPSASQLRCVKLPEYHMAPRIYHGSQHRSWLPE